jgi:hypothetical protein
MPLKKSFWGYEQIFTEVFAFMNLAALVWLQRSHEESHTEKT